MGGRAHWTWAAGRWFAKAKWFQSAVWTITVCERYNLNSLQDERSRIDTVSQAPSCLTCTHSSGQCPLSSMRKSPNTRLCDIPAFLYPSLSLAPYSTASNTYSLHSCRAGISPSPASNGDERCVSAHLIGFKIVASHPPQTPVTADCRRLVVTRWPSHW